MSYSNSLLIENIAKLCQIESANTGKKWVAGADMANLPCLDNAWVLTENGRITSFGSMDNPNKPQHAKTILDAKGGFVLPAWCDSHTHLVFAATRENEFEDKIRGLSYEAIAQKGGGILNSAQKLQVTPQETLFELAWQRLEEIVSMGTGAVEIKSGYGLTVEAELKMLRVIRKIKDAAPIPIKATFLGAHAYPTVYKNNHQGYIQQIIDEMLPAIAHEGLADYIDVFCERNFFDPEETDQILEAGTKFGLRAKIHANQLAVSGGVQVGVRHNALSVDHLEHTTQAEIDCLQNTNTMPVFLPSCSFFLGLPYGAARQYIAAGLPIALATDYNPGSTPSGNMPFLLSLACIQMKLLPEEAINAVTINGAYAMDIWRECGTIASGKLANLIITQSIQSLARLPYSFASDLVKQVIIEGKLAVNKQPSVCWG
ncbi:MAG: imidazolonepropionase [Sphingobacteriales bacterium]|jgi:imidazolonepropionase|nr:imidazolonepropionase [Sphingobacteriales bacterium]MBP9140626.1 imidazolonepropionase [Chitinophagales bacterium]MDA0199217.1 imidazolonepropionase [Bacteroidota bacterium]MBK6888634.1 imidazolonepropionase [Sphingobacteriales bacterium]MBK7528856.1 imidazolonepropionase [Sphingobacteriales bacterium]